MGWGPFVAVMEPLPRNSYLCGARNASLRRGLPQMGREKLRAFIGLRHPQRGVPLNFITIDCLPTDDATNAGPLSGRTHKHKQDPAISIGLFLIYLFISESGIAPVITQGRWLERSGLEFIIGVFAQLLGSELGESARFTRMHCDAAAGSHPAD